MVVKTDLGNKMRLKKSKIYLIKEWKKKKKVFEKLRNDSICINMKKVFEIVKITGVGVKECIYEEYTTGLIFHNKDDAEQEADRLWKEQTTEEDRKSGWCDLHFKVKERSIK